MKRSEMRLIIGARRALLLAINPNIFAEEGTGWAFTMKPGLQRSNGYHIIIKLYLADDAMSAKFWRWTSYVEDTGATIYSERHGDETLNTSSIGSQRMQVDSNGDPDLHNVMGYKGIYALCTTDKTGKMLKATHWASVLVAGPHPIWAVWTAKTGKFLRFYSYRSQIEEAYPKLVWRRRMATWNCVSVEDKSVEKRRAELATVYGKEVPSGGDES